MRKINKIITIDGNEHSADLITYSKTDIPNLNRLWKAWIKTRELSHKFGVRGTNLPEAISEVAFCIFTGQARLIKVHGDVSSSPDVYDFVTGRTGQIKATSTYKDLTTFGPKSEWDDLYFMDFSRLDASFDLFTIDGGVLSSMIVKKSTNVTFGDRQEAGGRPRIPLRKRIIEDMGIVPTNRNVKLYEGLI